MRSIDHLHSIRHGHENEAFAKQAYQRLTGHIVKLCGLHASLDTGIFDASPDGFVGDEGIIEIKCPSSLVGFPPTDMPEKMKISY